jgi:hypothetical protein
MFTTLIAALALLPVAQDRVPVRTKMPPASRATQPTPEPTTIGLLLLGAGGLAYGARRRAEARKAAEADLKV